MDLGCKLCHTHGSIWSFVALSWKLALFVIIFFGKKLQNNGYIQLIISDDLFAFFCYLLKTLIWCVDENNTSEQTLWMVHWERGWVDQNGLVAQWWGGGGSGEDGRMVPKTYQECSTRYSKRQGNINFVRNSFSLIWIPRKLENNKFTIIYDIWWFGHFAVVKTLKWAVNENNTLEV